ncbi:unnamed protein product [Vicia faba]|uniref:Uncharacterized protein n=1 Tax=Vicia faba TaxID=3906 RepID=A0AAV0ZLV7_VICFA|nr:unnamed protein product [Vicia faba]
MQNPRPRLGGIDFKKLSEEEKDSLEENFSRENFREVVFSCEGDRSLGPNGFNLDFLKRCWNVIGEEVIYCVQQFYHKAILPRAMTIAFLALIPKVDNP